MDSAADRPGLVHQDHVEPVDVEALRRERDMLSRRLRLVERFLPSVARWRRSDHVIVCRAPSLDEAIDEGESAPPLSWGGRSHGDLLRRQLEHMQRRRARPWLRLAMRLGLAVAAAGMLVGLAAFG